MPKRRITALSRLRTELSLTQDQVRNQLQALMTARSERDQAQAEAIKNRREMIEAKSRAADMTRRVDQLLTLLARRDGYIERVREAEGTTQSQSIEQDLESLFSAS